MGNADNIVPMPDMKDINVQASEWIVLLEDGELSAEQRVAFLAWRNASERHREAFDRLAALWGEYDHVTRLEDYAAADDNAQLLSQDARLRRWGALGRRPLLAGLAAALVLSVAGVVLLQLSPGWIGRDQSIYQTAIGEQQVINLPDGSTINLNTNSKVAIAYRNDARDIRLIDGEAHFDVTPDAARPFSVWVADQAVTAVGTAFTVRRLDDKIDVTVTKGRVALYAARPEPERSNSSQETEKRSTPSAELVAGQIALFSEKVEDVESIEPEDLAKKLSWRDGVLIFSGDPLSDVVADVSRYTDIAIEIDDASLADLPVNAYFRIGEIEEMFEALEIMADLKAERLGPKRVRFIKQQQG